MSESCMNCIYKEEYLHVEKNDEGDEYELSMICCSNSDSDSHGMPIDSDRMCAEHETDIFCQDEDVDLEEIKKELVENWNEDEEELEECTEEEIMDKYKDMKEEFNDDSVLFPNGRDHDAEDEDGI